MFFRQRTPKKKKQTFFALGLMSGTSLDGLDLCYCRFDRNEKGIWSFEIQQSETLPYSPDWEEQLRTAIHLPAEELMALHSQYGFYLGEKTRHFIKENRIDSLDVIASHGHTVHHQPHRRFTTQIGDGRAIKQLCLFPVAYDFRSQDVLMGGNGAPLVPIGDELLFHQYDACLNLGGFSNISLKTNGQRIAFDLCPVNTVLNRLAQTLGHPYDPNGQMAAEGRSCPALLEQLNQLEYYHRPLPKSLGIEWVERYIIPLIESEAPKNALATFTQHAAEQIAKPLRKYNLKNVLITGGGTHNENLINQIKTLAPQTSIIIPDPAIIDYKEALIFAFMGVLRLIGENNVLASATGSSKDHCSGLLV